MSNTYSEEANKVEKELNDAVYLRNAAIDNLHKQEIDFNSKLNELRRDTDNTHNQIHSAEAEVQRLREELGRIKASSAPKQHKLNDIERKQNIEDEIHARLAEETKAIFTKVEAEKKGNIALAKEAANLKYEVSQSEEILSKNKDTINLTENSLTQSRDATRDSEIQLRGLEPNIAQINREILHLENEKNNLEPEYENIQKIVDSLTLNFNKLNKRKLELEGDNANEAKKVKILEDKIPKTLEEIRSNELKFPDLN